MGTFKNNTAPALLRIGIILCLALFFLASAAVALLQGTFKNTGVTTVETKNGLIDLQGRLNDNSIFSLNGYWEYYPNVFEIKDHFDSRLINGITPTQVTFPLKNVAQSRGPATFRLLLQTDKPISNYAFYLKNYNEDFAIYVNGKRVTSIWGGAPSKPLYSLSDYLFRIDETIEEGSIEIIISANSSKDQSLLYRNGLLFGPADAMADYTAQVWRDDTFLIGTIMVMVIIGLVFTLFRTKFDMLTSIALFDTFLAIRILMGYNIATYFIHSIFPMQLSNVTFTGLQYTAFFLAGVFGCLLSQSIFDSKRLLSVLPVKIQVTICFVGAVFTFFCYDTFPGMCIALLFLVLLGSFLIVTWHVSHLIKRKELNGYYIFQILKTYYVGGIMILDIMNLKNTNYNALVYGYVIFMFAHLAARIMDNNASYKEVEILNHNLEERISARTSQLTETNRRLEELSIRDPLTQAHNRLYFEEKMESLLASGTDKPLYLCMFDLDYFKKINDQFGHIAGDEQLKFVVSAVNTILENRGTLSRVGGEEFVILFFGETKEKVLSILEQIRKTLHEDAMVNKARTTASFGLVSCNINSSSKDIMRAADKCLYCAKKMGRNCIIAV